MSVVKADRFTELKAKVKAEMLRRNQSGSVASYGGSEYDYTEVPAQGSVVRSEHRDKLTGPMRAVNSDVILAGDGGVISEEELADLETRVNVWAARAITDKSGSDCKSGCTGACYTGCATGCSGCGSGCPTSCSGCGSGCPTGCSNCGSGCSGGCYGCGDSCLAFCQSCDNGCATSCGKGCSTCSITCTSACDAHCTSSCEGVLAAG